MHIWVYERTQRRERRTNIFLEKAALGTPRGGRNITTDFSDLPWGGNFHHFRETENFGPIYPGGKFHHSYICMFVHGFLRFCVRLSLETLKLIIVTHKNTNPYLRMCVPA